MLRCLVFILSIHLDSCFQPRVAQPHAQLTSFLAAGRRSVLQDVAAFSVAALAPRSAHAQPKEFVGVDTQAPARDGDAPFATLPSGVKVKVLFPGQGEPMAAAGTTVSVQLNGRLLNLNGVSFYNTKNNNPDGFGAVPLTIPLGKGAALPGLEEGIVGMRKGEIRRIIVPSELGYSKFPGLEPVPVNSIDQQALDSVVKNPRRDATLLFDVKLEKAK